MIKNNNRAKKYKQLLVLLLSLLIVVTGLCQTQKQEPKKTSFLKRTSITIIPIVTYNKSYGIIAGTLVNGFTNVNIKDTISPPSMTGIGAGYTENKSWFAVAFQRLFLNKDKVRIVWALGLGKSNFQFFQENDDMAGGTFIDYSTHTQFVSATATYNIVSRLYTGLKYQYSKSVTEFDVQNKPNQVVRLSGFGIPVSFDSRNYVYYPTGGWSINAVFNSNVKWLGSDIAFSSLSFNANNYKKLSTKIILASRFFIYGGLGSVPFIGQKVIGGKDLRGYTRGEYRSNAVTALQTELRYCFHKKWGAVGFGGIANSFTSNGVAASGILPAAGAGIRYQIIPKRKINAGADIAIGKGDWGIYFRIGEAF